MDLALRAKPEVPDVKFSIRTVSRSCEIREARSGALRRSPRGIPEVNSRNGDAPADTCLLSPRASHGMKLLLALAYATTIGYAFADMRASERHYSAGGLDRVASRDNSVNCRSTPGTGWSAIC